jgi:hypothetical protein
MCSSETSRVARLLETGEGEILADVLCLMETRDREKGLCELRIRRNKELIFNFGVSIFSGHNHYGETNVLGKPRSTASGLL